MDENKDKLKINNIVDEVKSSFIDYSMSVIVSRALPDLRDGLKPVHRRILYAMYENGLTPEKQHRKSATIVGDVMGRYHPHGDSSIYDAMVRMAQDFNYRYMLVDGHGNFGNIEGYPAAAYRYTEARLTKISTELLRDIQKDTVDFGLNYDETRKEPEILPSRFPNILVNGTMGIAVGMATNIPPHNLKEVINGCIAYIDNPEIDTEGLMQYIKGPDFPTGGIILGNKGIRSAYETGRGTLTIRSRAVIEEKNGRNNIVITEVPYGVNTLELKNKVAELVHNKTLEGIADYHTDLKNGVTITITLKKDANPQVVLNNLYKHTAFQSNFGIIFLMLDNGVPKTLGLKDIISKYVLYQKKVITRRTKYDLNKAENRVHILNGLKIALDNIDEIIKIIKASKSDDLAKEELKTKFGLDDIQSEAILEMKLRRLTGLEREKIEKELAELLKLIEELKAILSSDERIFNIIKEELIEIREKYGDERKTDIDMTAIDYIEDESLIPSEEVIVSLTNKGYIKRVLTNTYKSQNRGGVGIKGMTTNEEDYVEQIITCNSHDYMMFFSNLGKVYRLKCYEIPEASRQSKGLPIINLLPLEKGERITSIINKSSDDNVGTIIFFTKKGLVKRTNVREFDLIRKNGKIAISLKDEDELIYVNKTTGNDEILIASKAGKMVRFNENDVRLMGRSASGVKGIELSNSEVVGAGTVKPGDLLLVITENGYGKKTLVDEYRLTHRGSKGVMALNITDKNGLLVAFKPVKGDEDVILTTNNGQVIRMNIEKISTLRRNTQGVRLMSLKENQLVTTAAIVDKAEETNETAE